MKKNLTTVFLLLTLAVQTVGLVVDFPWKGITIWTLSVVLILIAAYFTKYWQRKNTNK
jgi:hypothetical protein